jgi:serine/threonine protein kinase
MNIFSRVADVDASERSRLLDEACGSDELLRREVESLLRHHTTKALIETQPPPEATAKPASARDRVRKPQTLRKPLMRQATVSLKRRRPALAASGVTILIIIGTAYWVFNRVEQALHASIARQLKTDVAADVRALRMWITDRQEDVQAWAKNEEIRRLLGDLIDQTVNGEAGSERLSLLLVSVADHTEFNGFVLLDRDGNVVASSEVGRLGDRINSAGQHFVTRLKRGNLIFTIPSRESRFVMGLPSDATDPTIAVGAPVARLDDEEEIIGGLAFGYHAAQEVTHNLTVAQLDAESETFAFDEKGLLLSRLANPTPAVKAGLIKQGERTALNIELRNPGGNLLSGFRPSRDRKLLPMTDMVQRAVPDALDDRGMSEIGVDVTGYLNYLGIHVVGAWQWLGDDYGFGVATEMPYEKAYAPLTYIKMAFRFLLVSVVLLSLGLVLSSFSLIRLRDEVGKAKQLGAYELIQLIGQGGMGRVYQARHAFLKRDAAVKLLDGVAADRETVNRFELEVQLTCQLTHPNTIQIYDYGRTDEAVFYYAMEFLPGFSLEQVVTLAGKTPPARVVNILRQVCGSLQEAHDQGLIHRDVKPANIMLCRRGGIADFVKVLDFGIAKKLAPTEDLGITQNDSIVGTPHYIAPERVVAGNIDARSDLYSVACVGFYLLTGETPFDAKNPAQLFCRLMNEEAPAPSSRTEGIPPELDQLIQRCLQQDPTKRPASAAELNDLLEDIARQHPWTQSDATQWWDHYGATPQSSSGDSTDTHAPDNTEAMDLNRRS